MPGRNRRRIRPAPGPCRRAALRVVCLPATADWIRQPVFPPDDLSKPR
ncbi:hypothetical protein [Azospirillum endophyticum]